MVGGLDLMDAYTALAVTAGWIFVAGFITWIIGFAAGKRAPFWIGIYLLIFAVIVWIGDMWLQVVW